MLAKTTENLVSSYRESIDDSIGGNRIDEALNTLQDLVGNLAPELKNTVLMLRRRHSQYRQDKNRNVDPPGELDSITESLLAILSDAEERPALASKYNAPSRTDHASRQFGAMQYPALVPTPPEVAAKPMERMPRNGRSETAPRSDVTLDEQLRNHWREYRDGRPPRETTALVCDGITKRYRKGHFQLDKLSFSLQTGEIMGVVGRNASGKTTLLRMVLGEIVQDAGSLKYPSLTSDEESWQHVRRQIAYIPQFPGIWGGRVRTNLKYIAAANGSRRKANDDLVDWHIQRYGLASYEKSRCAELSGGFRMRYELVSALISRPKLLVLDEPLASLDVVARQEFLKNLRAIAYALEDPVPILVTSQHLYEVEAIADRMIILDGGKCLFSGSLGDLEVQSSLRLYELNIHSSKRSMLQILDCTQVQVLDTISDGYIIGVPKEIGVKESMKLLIDRFGDRLIGIRDITGSSRRFFVDAVGQKQGAIRP